MMLGDWTPTQIGLIVPAGAAQSHDESPADAFDALGTNAAAALSTISSVAVEGSARASEELALQGSTDCFVEMHNLLAMELIFLAGHGIMFLHGIADLLRARQAVHSYNPPVMTAALRAQLELAGRLAWLLEANIDPAERCLRYLTMRVHDLNNQLKAARTMLAGEALGRLLTELDPQSAHLARLASEAGWKFTSEAPQANGTVKRTTLQDAALTARVVPTQTELVASFADDSSVYPLLSALVHGERWAVHEGVSFADEVAPDGRQHTEIGRSSILDTEFIVWHCLRSSLWPVTQLMGWCGVDPAALLQEVDLVLRTAGIVRQST